MEGVEILNIIYIQQMHPMEIIGFMLLIFGGFLFIIALGCEERNAMIVFLIMTFIGMILLFYTEELEPKIQYEVTVDESVSYKKLTDKYNIIEQRGEIFVLEEKESDETSLLSGGEYK